MNKEILDCWVFPFKPRKNQLLAFDWLKEHENVKHLILEAPTGNGKSIIAVTYSRYKHQPNGNSFLLTPQKSLQHQYEQSFSDIKDINLCSLYGKANYQCSKTKSTCDVGSVLGTCTNCPYKEARAAATRNANVVMNYQLAFGAFAYTRLFTKRQLLVFDECHTLEDHLINFDVVAITQNRCKRYDIKFTNYKDMDSALSFVCTDYKSAIEANYATLQDECDAIKDRNANTLTKKEVGKLKECRGLGEHLKFIDDLSVRDKNDVRAEYIYVRDNTSFSFKRLYGRKTFNHIVIPKADQFLYMSSTILNKKAFCDDLGINENEAAFLSLTSEFDVKNRPVYFMPSMKMNFRWKNEENSTNRKKLIRTIEKLLELHVNESGVIHTGNYEISKWLIEHLDGNVKHKVFHHNPSKDSTGKREHAIDGFIQSKTPAVLISPSITEGLDLKDDLGRFAIIVKVPFPNLMDVWIKRRMELSETWYHKKTLIDVIQGSGRIVRTPEDKGTTYILDESFSYLKQRTSYMLPKWWAQALTVVDI